MSKGDVSSWNRLSRYYDVFMKKDRMLYKAIIAEIISRADSSNNILEIGTGTGILSLLLSEYITEITAIDYSKK